MGESGRNWARAGQRAERSEGVEEILFFIFRVFQIDFESLFSFDQNHTIQK